SNSPSRGARAHPSEASANRVVPHTNNRRRPKRSPAPPPSNSMALSGSRYALTVHCSASARAESELPIAGSATFTTEPSTNARLEASTEVTRTSRGCSAGADRSTHRAEAASQYAWAEVLIQPIMAEQKSNG